jgi:hypothetical protein
MTLELLRGFVETINLTPNPEDDKMKDKIWKNVPAVSCVEEILQVMNLYPSHRRPMFCYKTYYVAM